MTNMDKEPSLKTQALRNNSGGTMRYHRMKVATFAVGFFVLCQLRYLQPVLFDVSTSKTAPETEKSPPVILLLPSEPDPEIVNVITLGMTIQNPASHDPSYRPLHNCTITSQVQLILPTHASSKWQLQAVDQHGILKAIGGDEFYVTLYNVSLDSNVYFRQSTLLPPPTAVALVTDLTNGLYELDFVAPPKIHPSNRALNTTAPIATPGTGIVYTTEEHGVTVTVHFVSTCGMGQAYQPLKHGWMSGGGTRIGHMITVPSHMFGASTESASASVAPIAIRPFQPPSLEVDLSSMATVVFFGDSLIQQLSARYGDDLQYRRSNSFYQENVRRKMRNNTVTSWLETLEEWHGAQLRQFPPSTNSTTKRVALVTGSSAWEILTRDNDILFQDHLKSVESFVTTVQQRYHWVHLIWKLPSALHLHRAGPDCWGRNVDCVGQLRYMSNARVAHLQREQKRIMDALRIPVMDVYQGSYLSAHHTYNGDALHYQSYFSAQMLSWFYDRTDEPVLECPGRMFDCHQ